MELAEFMKIINTFPTKSALGFTCDEKDNLLCLLSDFYDKDSYMMFSNGHTVTELGDGTIIHYPWDIKNDLQRAFKNRCRDEKENKNNR